MLLCSAPWVVASIYLGKVVGIQRSPRTHWIKTSRFRDRPFGSRELGSPLCLLVPATWGKMGLHGTIDGGAVTLTGLGSMCMEPGDKT